MRSSTRSGVGRTPRFGDRGARDRGYVLALVGLLLVPLVGFTGFAVDLGAWYARAAQIQRATDAAALAGVVFLPEIETAEAKALEVAERNGFVHDQDGITVEVEPVEGYDNRLRVTITDTAVDKYFSGVVLDENVTIQRTSTAEFIRQVRMGSPRNYLGTFDDPSGDLPTSLHENFALAISGGCASKEQGDRIATQTDANFDSTQNPPFQSKNTLSKGDWNRCTGGTTVTNEEYSADGYFYAVEVPEDFTGDLRIQVYDAPICSGSELGDTTFWGYFDTTFRVRDNSSFDPLQTNILSTVTLDEDDCDDWQDRWVTLQTIDGPSPGVYYVQVTSQSGSGTTSHDSNAFSLRAFSGASFSPCSSDPTEPTPGLYSPTCPNVFAVENLGVYAGLEGSQAEFFLTSVTEDHNNKVLELTLWDPGEGSQALQVLDPTGAPAPFFWEVLCHDGSRHVDTGCPGETAPTGGWGPGASGNVTIGATTYANAIETVGHRGSPCANSTWVCNPQPGPHRASKWKYSDRSLRLYLQLPEDIAAEYGGRTWWKVRYHVGEAPNDRTTWSAVVRGDAVRLVPNE